MMARRIWRPFRRHLALLVAPVPTEATSSAMPLADARHAQMLYKSRSWRDVERSLKDTTSDAESVVTAWNTLKTVPDSYQSPRALLEELLKRTLDVSGQLSVAGYAALWHALGKMNLLHPELLQKLAQRLTTASGELPVQNQLSPQGLTNLIHAVAKLHRLARVRQKLLPNGESFEGESTMTTILIKESIKRLNEFNERDVATLVLAMGLLERDQPPHVGHQLAAEVEKILHLNRLWLRDFVNIAFGLTIGCGLDLFQATPRLVETILHPKSCAEYAPRQLALLMRCFTQIPNPSSHAARIRPLFYRLIHPEVLPTLHSLEQRSVVRGLGLFRLRDPELWGPLTDHLIEQDLKGLSPFDVSALLYSMALVQYHRAPLLEKIAEQLLQEGVLDRLSRLGFSNCFFGVATLNYRNRSFIQALCTSLMQRGLSRSLLPSQMSNVVFSLAQLSFRYDPLIQALVTSAVIARSDFPNRALLHFLFGLSLNLYYGRPCELMPLFEELLEPNRLRSYTNGEIGMALCTMGKLKPAIGHKWTTLIQEVQSERRLKGYSLQDLIRIGKALHEMQQPMPLRLKEPLLNEIQQIEALPNRSLLDLLHCLEAMEDEKISAEMEAALKLALSDERLQKLRGDEISEFIVSLVYLNDRLPSEVVDWIEQILERVIVQGSLKQLTTRALYFAVSILGHSKRLENTPVLYSLAMECTKESRLGVYNEQELTGIFYNLSILNALHRTAFDVTVEEMMKPERLSRYREQHVAKALKGLSLGRYKNSQITNTLLNAFLQPDLRLQPVSVASLLFNLVLLKCWKQPYIDLLLGQISREADLSGYGIWEIGIVVNVLGRMQHRHEAALKLLKQEITPNRLREATQTDLCNLVFGLARLRIHESEVVQPLLSEVLKSARCRAYSLPELVKLLESLSEWRIADPTQLSGLVSPLCDPQRGAAFGSLQLMTVLRALAKLRLLDHALVEPLLTEFTASEPRLAALSVEHLQELSYLTSLAGVSAASARFQNALAAKQCPET